VYVDLVNSAKVIGHPYIRDRKHLQDSFDGVKFHEDTMPLERGRTCFKLSETLFQDDPDDMTEAEDLRGMLRCI
jgi:hypothetical protein